MFEAFVPESNLRNEFSAQNGSRVSIRMPSSQIRSGFTRSGHRIWIQHEKNDRNWLFGCIFLNPDSRKRKIESFQCFGCTEEPWTTGDGHVVAPGWPAHQARSTQEARARGVNEPNTNELGPARVRLV